MYIKIFSYNEQLSDNLAKLLILFSKIKSAFICCSKEEDVEKLTKDFYSILFDYAFKSFRFEFESEDEYFAEIEEIIKKVKENTIPTDKIKKTREKNAKTKILLEELKKQLEDEANEKTDS